MIPERRRLGVKQAHGERAAGHVERGDVAADQRARDAQAALFKLSLIHI